LAFSWNRVVSHLGFGLDSAVSDHKNEKNIPLTSTCSDGGLSVKSGEITTPTKFSPQAPPTMLKVLSFSSAALLVAGHGRWKCPVARDELDENGNHIAFDNTANKYAACGPQSGNWGFGQITTLSPGWTTFTWEESITHTGSPFRIAILDETETARVVLLDHIPHNEDSLPDRNNEETYVPYKISVNIPNVKCDKCSLQLLYVMTDKSVKCGSPICYYNPEDAACKGSTDPAAETCAGAPNSEVCTAEDLCFSNCKFL
jgi:hypothetical protein